MYNFLTRFSGLTSMRQSADNHIRILQSTAKRGFNLSRAENVKALNKCRSELSQLSQELAEAISEFKVHLNTIELEDIADKVQDRTCELAVKMAEILTLVEHSEVCSFCNTSLNPNEKVDKKLISSLESHLSKDALVCGKCHSDFRSFHQKEREPINLPFVERPTWVRRNSTPIPKQFFYDLKEVINQAQIEEKKNDPTIVITPVHNLTDIRDFVCSRYQVIMDASAFKNSLHRNVPPITSVAHGLALVANEFNVPHGFKQLNTFNATIEEVQLFLTAFPDRFETAFTRILGIKHYIFNGSAGTVVSVEDGLRYLAFQRFLYACGFVDNIEMEDTISNFEPVEELY